MDERNIAAIALSNRDFPSLQSKLLEAAEWLALAAGAGADMVVFPETINRYCGDGPNNPLRQPCDEIALDHWQRDCAVLIESAIQNKVAATIPVLRRDGDVLSNCFFLISKDGRILGEYKKRCPTIYEIESNIPPARTQLIEWEGLQVGGAICFDTLFPEVFSDQVEAGARLFLVPSLWPGGSNLDFYALEHSCPIVLAYPAWSRILDANGSELAAGGHRSETLRFGFGSPVVMAPINFDSVVLYGNENQQKMVDVQRHYGRRVRIAFDQKNVIFFVESRCADLSIEEVVRQFGLMPRRAYLRRCREAIVRGSRLK
jgi:predicted amidohydrolase